LIKDDFFVYGRQPVFELLRSGHPVSHLICSFELEEKYKKRIISLAQKKNIHVEYIARAKLQKFTGPVVHQGIAAKIEEYKYTTEESIFDLLKENKISMIVILDQIQDPHNVGAIIRTAEIIGRTAIVLPKKGSAPINSTVAKTSSGSIFHAPIHLTNNLFKFIGRLKEKRIKIIAAIPGQQNNIYKTCLTGPVAFIFGSEGEGVRKNLLSYCDVKISIPQAGMVDSLNVSVTAAIVLFESLRQREYNI
jgi:23S rRNA (guanosine2251-2'-O)-methyltransferase